MFHWKGEKMKARRNHMFALAAPLFLMGMLFVPMFAGVCLGTGMYWTNTNNHKIQRSDLNGGGIENLVTGDTSFFPRGIALDLVNNKMYWCTLDGIGRSDLNGDNVEYLPVSNANAPVAIALDLTNGKIYWTEFNGNKVRRANLDGTLTEDLVTTGNYKTGIAVDPAGGKVYWGELMLGILRADLNGSNAESLVSTDVRDPSGIALDVGAGKMYWTDASFSAKIRRANLDGSGVEDLVTTGLLLPRGIALDLDSGKMYWTDSDADKIQRANLDGTAVETLIQFGLDNALGIALDLRPDIEVTVVTPNGGEDLIAGSTYDITWATGGPVNDVEILYSLDNGGVWNAIGQMTNSGSYEWTVPEANSSRCLIKVRDIVSSVTDTSEAVFRIFICTHWYEADVNMDCHVNLGDLAVVSEQWLMCGDPYACPSLYGFTEDFESGDLSNWEFTYSTNAQQTGSIINPGPGTWTSQIVADPDALEGAYSARIRADSTSSASPWAVIAAINRQVGAVETLSVNLKFDVINGSSGRGNSYFQIALLSAGTGNAISYGFNPTGDAGGDNKIIVAANDELNFVVDVAHDYFDKYGTEVPDDLILRFMSWADYDEDWPTQERKTADVRVDSIIAD